MYVYRAQACLASSVIYSCCFYLYLLYVLVMKLWCNCLQGDLQSHVQDHLDFRPQASLQSVRQISMNSVFEVAISKTWWVCCYLTPPPPPPHTHTVWVSLRIPPSQLYWSLLLKRWAILNSVYYCVNKIWLSSFLSSSRFPRLPVLSLPMVSSYRL